MSKASKKFSAVLAAAMVSGVLAAPVALATDYCPPPPPPSEKKKCNSGRGNGSEGCDPGKSSTNPNGSTGQNQGGDEGGPVRGGTGTP
jgi:hypothetical protein